MDGLPVGVTVWLHRAIVFGVVAFYPLFQAMVMLARFVFLPRGLILTLRALQAPGLDTSQTSTEFFLCHPDSWPAVLMCPIHLAVNCLLGCDKLNDR